MWKCDEEVWRNVCKSVWRVLGSVLGCGVVM